MTAGLPVRSAAPVPDGDTTSTTEPAGPTTSLPGSSTTTATATPTTDTTVTTDDDVEVATAPPPLPTPTTLATQFAAAGPTTSTPHTSSLVSRPATVTVAAAGPTPDQLPATGIAHGGELVLAAVLVAVGLVAASLGRRRAVPRPVRVDVTGR
jgi:hypothetical protein